METMYLVIGFLLGALCAWYIAGMRARQASVPRIEFDALTDKLNHAATELRVESERRKTIAGQLTASEAALRSLEELEREHTRQIASLAAQKQAADEKLETQKAEIESIRRQSEAEFKLIANQILEEKSARFTEMNKLNLESILKPLGENLEGFRKKVDDVYEKEAQQRFSLREKVAELVALNERLSADAMNLTKALEGSTKTQGDWGETILERILEISGLEKGREFVVQEFLRDDDGSVLRNEDGSRMRPDVIVMYPGNRKVIIDSKVSLVAYKRYSIAESRDEQQSALKEHVGSMKRHIDDLSRKNYPDFTQSLDFVLMFVPIEPAFMAAMHHDPELWSYAYEKRVLLISPTNLIAALKLVADLWKREYQNRHAIEIAETGGALYDKFVGFVHALQDVGRHIEKAQESYSNSMKLLSDGNGNLIRRVEKLKTLGVKAKKTLPSGLLTGSAENEDAGDAEGTFPLG